MNSHLAKIMNELAEKHMDARNGMDPQGDYYSFKAGFQSGVTEANKVSEEKLAIAVEALKLIEDKMPRCECMDAPAIAQEALRRIEEK